MVTEAMHSESSRPHWLLPRAQLAWLSADLTQNAATPPLIVCHYPAVAIPERTARPGMRDAGELDNGDELVALLQNHPQVRAIFSGHFHMNLIVQQAGLTHVITGALPEYPTEYREIRVYDDRLEIATLGLSDPSFAARSMIPGNGWTAGQAADRVATIPLS